MNLQITTLFIIPPPITITSGDTNSVMFRHNCARQQPTSFQTRVSSDISAKAVKSTFNLSAIDLLQTMPSMQICSLWNGHTPLKCSYQSGCLSPLPIAIFLHDVAAFRMGQPMYGSPIGDDPHPHPRPHRNVGQRLSSPMISQPKFCIRARIDICINTLLSLKLISQLFKNIDVPPFLLGSGSDSPKQLTIFVKAQRPKRGNTHKLNCPWLLLLSNYRLIR